MDATTRAVSAKGKERVMIKMARICDICGREIGKYNARYSLSYKTALFSKEKDICTLCFDRLKEQFKGRESEQTEPTTDCGLGEPKE